MGNAVLKNPRVVTVTDPVFGPRKEAQADLYDVERKIDIMAYQTSVTRDVWTFVCIVSLGTPVERDEESAPPSTIRFRLGTIVKTDEEPSPPSAPRPTT